MRRFDLGRVDVRALAVAPAGLLLILIAQFVDGIAARSLLQLVPALIVFGGTAGALLVTYRFEDLRQAAVAAVAAFDRRADDSETLAASLVALSLRAHRRGVVILESELDTIDDEFLREGLALAIDGVSPETLRDHLRMEKASRDAGDEAPARVFETAAGYAPTFGILGAVLGLMRVMEHLASPASIGPGIALAFVATVYGVGAANLVLLPMAGRIRERAAVAARRRELASEGVLAIHQRLHPGLAAHRLRIYAPGLPRIEEIAGRGSLQRAVHG